MDDELDPRVMGYPSQLNEGFTGLHPLGSYTDDESEEEFDRGKFVHVISNIAHHDSLTSSLSSQ